MATTLAKRHKITSRFQLVMFVPFQWILGSLSNQPKTLSLHYLVTNHDLPSASFDFSLCLKFFPDKHSTFPAGIREPKFSSRTRDFQMTAFQPRRSSRIQDLEPPRLPRACAQVVYGWFGCLNLPQSDAQITRNGLNTVAQDIFDVGDHGLVHDQRRREDQDVAKCPCDQAAVLGCLRHL